MRAVAAGVVAGLVPLVVGCAAGGGGVAADSGGTVDPTSSTRQVPVPSRTVVRAYPVLHAGATGTVGTPGRRAAVRITAGGPAVATSRLSSGYGYAPAHGHYVTFRLTIVNAGRLPVAVQRLDFFVRTPGLGRVTTDDGNAPFSGSGRQLDSTELGPGQQLHNDLTFDVATPHGRLFYAPGGDASLAWSF